MHQTAQGKQRCFVMNAHVGVESRTKLIHAILASAANVHDRETLPHLLQGKETRVWGGQGYNGQPPSFTNARRRRTTSRTAGIPSTARSTRSR